MLQWELSPIRASREPTGCTQLAAEVGSSSNESLNAFWGCL